MRKRILFIFFLFSVGGCVPVIYNYYYISLDITPDLRVTEYGQSEIYGIIHQKDMPMKYELARDSYSIEIVATKLSFFGTVLLKAISKDGKILKIDYPNVLQKCGFLRKPFPQNSEGMNVDEVVKFIWSDSKCNKEANMVITFEIIDSDGNILGKEELPFTIKKNGYYYQYDAI